MKQIKYPNFAILILIQNAEITNIESGEGITHSGQLTQIWRRYQTRLGGSLCITKRRVMETTLMMLVS